MLCPSNAASSHRHHAAVAAAAVAGAPLAAARSVGRFALVLQVEARAVQESGFPARWTGRGLCQDSQSVSQFVRDSIIKKGMITR